MQATNGRLGFVGVTGTSFRLASAERLRARHPHYNLFMFFWVKEVKVFLNGVIRHRRKDYQLLVMKRVALISELR